jgi:hypothetical protein
LAILTEQLQVSAGIDPQMDRFNVGYISAVKDFLLVSLDDVGEDSK